MFTIEYSEYEEGPQFGGLFSCLTKAKEAIETKQPTYEAYIFHLGKVVWIWYPQTKQWFKYGL